MPDSTPAKSKVIKGTQPAQRTNKGSLPVLLPSRAVAQDATAPGSLYRTNPGSPAAQSNEHGSFTGAAVVAMRKALPINVAMFAQDLTGNKLPLTEKDLTADELNVLRATARNTRNKAFTSLAPADRHNPGIKNNLTYFEYPEQLQQVLKSPDPNNRTELLNALRSPLSKMSTTIGQATLQPNQPKTNATVLTDSFDFGGGDGLEFARAQREGRVGTTPQILGRIAKSLVTAQPKERDFGTNEPLYENIRYLEGKYGSTVDGQGIPVEVNLGNLKRPIAGEFPAPTRRVIRGTQPASN